jgi:glycosyltransferase involved in cell wall biosynthesis
VSGYVDTEVNTLIAYMQQLLREPEKARQLGEGARRFAEEHFSIERFVDDWDATLQLVTGNGYQRTRNVQPVSASLQ